jgi:SNF2 family DNA or RNA helicase
MSKFLSCSILYSVLIISTSLFRPIAGKTVQIISLLSALFHKTGTGLDLQRIQRRQKAAAARAARETREKQTALLAGRVWKDSVAEDFEPDLARWAPVLIVVPPSIIQNWTHDFDMWGHFSIVVYQGPGRTKALESIQRGVAEVLICSKALFMQVSDFQKLSAVPFKLIIVDEFHQFKNKKGLMAAHLRGIRDEQSALVIGLTGTVMQNRYVKQ